VPDQGRIGGKAGRRILRAALLAWAVCAIVVWNVVFDAIVIQSGREYLTRQALHQQGQGPPVTIHEIMDAGVAKAARSATAAGGAVAAAGILMAWLAARPGAGRSAGGAE
jgi:hypothetical protein